MAHSVRQKELARDLDSYLSERRKKDPYEVPVETIRSKPTEEQQLTEPEQSSEDEIDSLYDGGKKSWLGTLFDRFFAADENDTADEEMMATEASSGVSNQEIQQDMRELAQISLAVIKQLPEGTLQEFKESSEFVKFKELLRKHSIIK